MKRWEKIRRWIREEDGKTGNQEMERRKTVGDGNKRDKREAEGGRRNSEIDKE